MPKIECPSSADICFSCSGPATFIAINSKKKRCVEKITKCPAFIERAKAKRWAGLSKDEMSAHMKKLSVAGNKSLERLHADAEFIAKKSSNISRAIERVGGRCGDKNSMYGKSHSPNSKQLMSEHARARPPSFYENNIKRRIENGHIVPIELKTPFEQYHQLVDKFTRRAWISFQAIINPENLQRGDQYELDHIVSIVDGFINNIPPEIIGSHCNLRIISKFENRSKHSKSDMTVEELTQKYNSL